MGMIDRVDSISTHWGRVTHICVGKLHTIGSDNGMSPRRRQAIFWTNAGIVLIRPLGTNFSEILYWEIKHFHSRKCTWNCVCEMAAICLGLNVLIPSKPKVAQYGGAGLWRYGCRSSSQCRVVFLYWKPYLTSSWVYPWWRHQKETFSALLAICAGNSPVPGEFPTQRPVTRSFDVFSDLRLNKRLSKPW